MTSVSLYFKMIVKDIKRRIWCPVGFLVIFFLAMEVNCLISLQQMQTSIQGTENLSKDLERYYFNDTFLTPDYGSIMVILMVFAAICCGISGFTFLNSKKQIDLYHSLPVSRGTLFAVKYVSGVICFLLPFLLNLGLTVIMAAARGIVNGQTIRNTFGLIAFELIYFLCIYTVVIIAVLLTGNIVLNFIASIVLLFYNFLFWGAFMTLRNTFFSTFVPDFFKPFIVLTPMQAMVNSYTKMSDYRAAYGEFSYRAVSGDMLILIPVTIVLIIIAWFLMKKRPSESAEKSIAFKVSEPVIKTLFIIPSAILSASLFFSISNEYNFGWFIFGGIFGFLIIGLVMEMIFRQDFKGAFHHWKQLVINFAILIAITLCCKLDFIGYDTYLPASDQLANMGVSINNLDNGISYYVNNQYVTNKEYRLNHMEITEMKDVYSLADIATSHLIDRIEYALNTDENKKEYVPISVVYRLQNGRQIYREYLVDGETEEVMDLLDQIYSSKEYKHANFHLLEEFDDSYYQIITNATYEDDVVKLNNRNRDAFFEAYSQDLETLTLEQIRTEFPLGSIGFERKNDMGIAGRSYMDTYGYPIYPDFQKTIAWFQTQGVDFTKTEAPNHITEITVWDYTKMVGEEFPNVTYEDEETIHQLMENATSCFDMHNTYYMPIDTNLEIDITYVGAEGINSRYLTLKKGTLPEAVRRDLDAFEATAEEE